MAVAVAVRSTGYPVMLGTLLLGGEAIAVAVAGGRGGVGRGGWVTVALGSTCAVPLWMGRWWKDESLPGCWSRLIMS